MFLHPQRLGSYVLVCFRLEQILTIQTSLENDQWHKETKTLSKLGAVIVQAAVMYFTAGAGAGLIEVGNTVAQAMVDQAVNSMINQVTTELATAALTGNDPNLDMNAMFESAIQSAALVGMTSSIDTQFGFDAVDPTTGAALPLSVSQQVQQTVLHSAAQSAVTGVDLEDTLASNFASLAAAGVASSIGDNQEALGSVGYNASHAVLGCAVAEAGGGACEAGAISAVVGENIAIGLGELGGIDKVGEKEILLFSQLGGALVAGSIKGDPAAAMAAVTNAVKNNYLNHTEQKRYASEINAALAKCAGDTSCITAERKLIDDVYQVTSDTNNEALQQALTSCAADTKNCQQVQTLLNEASPVLGGKWAETPEVNPNFELPQHLREGALAEQQQNELDIAAHNESTVNTLLDKKLSEEVVKTDAIAAHPGPQGGVESQSASYESAISAENTDDAVTAVGTAVTVGLLLVPDPTDIALGAIVATKLGSAVVKFGKDGVTKVLQFASGKKVEVNSKEYDKLFSKKGIGTDGTVGAPNDPPYNSRDTRAQLEEKYGADNVVSTTVPPINKPNVKLAGQKHPKTGVVFDQKGFPIFDDYAKFDTKIDVNLRYGQQMQAASLDLSKAIDNGQIPASQFTVKQLQQIRSGSKQVDGLTWHHHQDSGRMQLIPRKLHNQTNHIGGNAIQEGR